MIARSRGQDWSVAAEGVVAAVGVGAMIEKEARGREVTGQAGVVQRTFARSSSRAPARRTSVPSLASAPRSKSNLKIAIRVALCGLYRPS